MSYNAGMYLRSVVKKKRGKAYRYWLLVESIRTARGPRQRVVANLGDISSYSKRQWESLAARLGEDTDIGSLKERVKKPRRGRPKKHVLRLVGKDKSWITVRLGEVGWKDPRSFGDVYVGLELWNWLGLGKVLRDHVQGYRDIPIETIASLMAVNRLVAPASEWAMVRWWSRTALPELLGLPRGRVDDNRLYRCLDALQSCKRQIENHLAKMGGELFRQDFQFLLYDLTSTYFEGQMQGNRKAKRGYSRDHRPDCKQVCIGLAVNAEGYPVGFETEDGNVRDHATVEKTLKKLKSRFGDTKRVVIMDRGMVTKDTLKCLRKERWSYVVAERRAASGRYMEHILNGEWKVAKVSKGGEFLVEVQEAGQEECDRVLLVRSKGCRAKEEAIHDRILNYLQDSFEKLAKRVKAGRLKDPVKIERKIGSIFAKYPGSARWARAELVRRGDGEQMLEWSIFPEAREELKQLEGVYVLRTNVKKFSEEEIWRSYVQLTQVETAFRVMKFDLALRPIFHHKEIRSDAHILLTYIAYVMYWTLEYKHRSRGGELTGRRLLEILHEIELATITLKSIEGLRLAFRKVSALTQEQREVLATLGINLPKSIDGMGDKIRVKV